MLSGDKIDTGSAVIPACGLDVDVSSYPSDLDRDGISLIPIPHHPLLTFTPQYCSLLPHRR